MPVDARDSPFLFAHRFFDPLCCCSGDVFEVLCELVFSGRFPPEGQKILYFYLFTKNSNEFFGTQQIKISKISTANRSILE